MDLELFARVLWRHKIVTICGATLGIVLALLSIVRVTPGGIAYRDTQEWVSYQTMLVTQPGFAEGALNPRGGAEESRLTLLAVLYSQFVDADQVTKRVWPNGHAPSERLEAAPVLTLPGSSAASALPIVSLAAFSSSPAKAQSLATRGSAALAAYIQTRQTQAHITDNARVQLKPIQQAKSNQPKLWQGRKKTLAIVIFMTVWIATIGLAFVLENLNPTIRELKEEPPQSVSGVAS